VIRLILIVSLIHLAACSPKNEAPTDEQLNKVQIDSSAFAAQVGIVAYTSLSNASQTAQTFDSKLSSFMYHPNPMSQTEIQQFWRLAYDSFLRSLIFSYLPIQDPPEWQSQRIGYRHLLAQVDSWPIEGGYIDYIQGYPFSGIVNDLTLKIDESSVRSQHGFTDPTNASLGYHALEFMLWGNDGKRSARDFFPQENTAPIPINDAEVSAEPRQVSSNDSSHTSANQSSNDSLNESPVIQAEAAEIKPQNHNRRRQYAQLLIELLQKDLHRIQRRWEPSSGYYAQLLQQSDSDNILRSAFVAAQGLISKEILQKRFQLISSEFSQTSIDDISALLSGLEHWFMPVEEDLQEASLLFLLQQTDNQLATEFLNAIKQLKTCLTTMSADDNSRDQCKQDSIQLLAILRKSANALMVNLPPLN
jgi:putative iron-regulated protein